LRAGWHKVSPMELNDTGVYLKVEPVWRIPDFDPRSRAHYWVFPVVFRVEDPAKALSGERQLMLDPESMVCAAQALGCFYCEEPYSERLADGACRGNGGWATCAT
jgi:hypothetical protein